MVRGTNPQSATLKRINMRRFLEELRRRGPSTRADLTRAIGVTPPTSSSVIADLLEAGYLEETEIAPAGRGRPGKLFRLATSTAYVIGAAVDVRDCEVVVAGLDGKQIHASERFATPTTYPELIDMIVGIVNGLAEVHTGKCLGLGIAVPGLVDERHGMVAFSPNLHYLDGNFISRDLSQRLGIEVVTTQEEHALCLSEQIVGKAKRLDNFAVMDFSSGVGMGVVSGGRYVSGYQGFAGEIGHIQVVPNGLVCGCGNRGCLETVASDSALMRSVADRVVAAKVNTDVPIESFLEMCTDEEVERTAEFVSLGIATAINLFNPSAVFVSGRLFNLRPGLSEQIAQMSRDRALKPSAKDVRVELAQGTKLHGATSGLLDALYESVGPRLA